MNNRLVYSMWAALCLLASPAAAQFSVTQPAGATPISIRAANDFATRAFQDPWDMNQRTDVGWWTFGADTAAVVNFKNPTVANGVFTGSMTGSAAGVYLLESPLPPTTPGGQATPAGKTGQQFPIDASTYTHLVYRMNSTIGGATQFIWSTNSWAQDMTFALESPAPTSTVVRPGWKIYDVDLTSIPNLVGLVGGALAPSPWSGTKRALQMIPLGGSPTATIQIDWVRLVQDDPSLKQDIVWTGGAADVYLDNDSDPSNGTLGRIAVNVTSPFKFFVGALPAGRYFVAVHATTPNEVAGSAGGFFSSTGSYQVSDIPTIQFTTPSDEGSSDDFATTRLGDAWDFKTLGDIDSTLPGFSGKVNIIADGLTSLVLTSEAGVNLGSQTVYLGTSAPAIGNNPGNPQIFPLFWDGKGRATRIDPNRYRILTIEAGIPNTPRSLINGSIGRVAWRAFNEPANDPNTSTKAQTIGELYELNSASGENTVSKISVDMKNWPVSPLLSLDTNTTWSSPTATNGGIDGFRFDPHEFKNPTQFFVKRIKLAALERTQADQFTFRWTTNEAATVAIFYDQDPAHGFAGTQACTTSAPAGAGSCMWDASGIPNGEYQIYATIDDGTSSNRVYAATNVIVDHGNQSPTINLNRTTLYFSQLGPIRSDPQTVRLTFSGPGTNSCWTATPNAPGLLTISPSSGTGAAFISIGPSGFFPAGTMTTLFVTIASCVNPSNSRAIAVNVHGLTSSQPPVGFFDTPADGSVVVSSFAVTGWAADDIGVRNVAICRDPVAGEGTTPALCGGASQVFIANALFVEDARSDIEGMFPTVPASYRAGWGYLLLSNFLPNQGNGNFRLYAWATDVEGRVALLGSKTVIGDNSHATKPFGAIDTPAPGQVVCGTIANAGWVLTQRPKDIAQNTSAVTAFIDGQAIGNVGPRLPRADIDGLFSPAYDTSHAVGGAFIDTTTFSNGVHTIFWVVTDTTGQTDGIGSRFFIISNPCPGG